jgi:hypothetical protein
VIIRNPPEEAAGALRYLIKNLTSMTHLKIADIGMELSSIDAFGDMMTDLKHHPSLETLTLRIPSRLYSVVMPCLDRLPKLQRICIDFISEIDDDDSANDDDSFDDNGDGGDNNSTNAQQTEDDGTANDHEALLERERVELAEAQALSELLGLAKPRVHLRIEEFKCSSLPVKTALAAAISRTSINGLDVYDCCFGGSATFFANALTSSRLQT